MVYCLVYTSNDNCSKTLLLYKRNIHDLLFYIFQNSKKARMFTLLPVFYQIRFKDSIVQLLTKLAYQNTTVSVHVRHL